MQSALKITLRGGGYVGGHVSIPSGRLIALRQAFCFDLYFHFANLPCASGCGDTVCRKQGRLRGRDRLAAGWFFVERIFQCLGRTLLPQ